MAEKVTYDDSSIRSLRGAARVRKRPAAVLGSDGLDGARHGFTEIYGNALDEISSGYGDRLDVRYHADGSLSVRDYGRGVPLGWNEAEKCYNWHCVYNELYAGGKYATDQDKLQSMTPEEWKNFNEKDYNYLYSVGLNGLGAASTQYTSEFFHVKSFRDGKCTEMQFKKGLPVINGEAIDLFAPDYVADWSKLAPTITDTDEPNGTYIHWKPDSEVFTDINVGEDWVYGVCKDIAYIAGVDLYFVGEQSGREETIKAGDVSSLVLAHTAGKQLKDEEGTPFVFTTEGFDHGSIKVNNAPFTWVCKLDLALTLTTEEVQPSCYHNCIKMNSGSQYEAIDTALYKFFKGVCDSKGVSYNVKDHEGLISVVISTKSNYASFRGQTKDAVDNLFIFDLIRDTLYDKLMLEYSKGTPAIVNLVNDVCERSIQRAQIAAAARQIREARKVTRNKAPLKFATCKAYMKRDSSIAELWITEGDSAAGAVKQARNSDFQAVMPVRGKCLNVLKSSIEKAVKNQEIKDIFGLLGTGMDIGVKDEEDLFDLSALRFDKIIFATDADEDGFQIRVLLFLIFYKYAPQLIREGHVYIAETPRFEIKLSNGETLYALTDRERDQIKAQYAGQIRGISRFKGLGEVNPDVLRKTTVHPDTRHLVPLTMDFDNRDVHDLIDALFGADKFHQRKEILTQVLGEDVAEMLEANAMMLEDIEDSDIEDGITYQVV